VGGFLFFGLFISSGFLSSFYIYPTIQHALHKYVSPKFPEDKADAQFTRMEGWIWGYLLKVLCDFIWKAVDQGFKGMVNWMLNE